MASTLEKAILSHRARLRAIDRAALAQVYLAYQDAMDEIEPLIERLQQDLARRGQLSASELFRLERYQEVQRQIEARMADLARRTGDITETAQRRAVDLALEDSKTLASASATTRANAAIIASTWVNVPTWAVEDFIGATKAGPLRDLLATFETVTGQEIVKEIVTGLAAGTNPRAVAEAIRRGTEVGRNRALLISRTEMMRSLRGATLSQYESNRDILSGWRWLSSLSERTCSACLAMHGTEHPLDEPMESHPACRCAAAPILRDMPTRTVPSGEQWLRAQPLESQEAVLGKSGAAYYRAGAVELADFVKVTHSDEWGKSVSDGGIAFALRNAANRDDRIAA